MNLKHKEHDLTEIAEFGDKILIYAEINLFGLNWNKGYVLQGLRTFCIDLARSDYLFIF